MKHFRKPRLVVAAFAVAWLSLAGGASGAKADVVWTLADVPFIGGGSLSGTFTIDVNGYITQSSISLTTTAGALPGATYTDVPVSANINNVGGSALPDNVVQFFSTASGDAGQLQLTFANSLTVAGIDPIIGGSGGPSWECGVGFGCPPFPLTTPIRYVADSDASFASAVPEPATWVMMLLGLLGVGSVAYRRSGQRPRFFPI